jgi:hypothetical protein
MSCEKDILRYVDSKGNIVTLVSRITAGEGVKVTRPKDASGKYELDEVLIESNLAGLEVDEDIYALLQVLNDEVI